MGFPCPDCAGALEIGSSIELGADARSDEIALQLIRCTACAFRGIAVYQESRRGALDEECSEHIGYRLAPPVLERLEGLLAACPRPRDAECSCAAHTGLRQLDPAGCWIALASLQPHGEFALRSNFS
jgi:hypothetical protein